MKKLLIFVSSRFSYQPSKFRVAHLRFYCDRPPSSLSKHPGPLAYYKSLVNQGKLKHDSYQEKVAFQLENLLGRLDQYEKDMKEYHVNLAKWEENRENERRRLLLEEANTKQQGGASSSSASKRRNFLNKWMSRDPDSVEPGMGKWVSFLNREKKLDLLVGHIWKRWNWFATASYSFFNMSTDFGLSCRLTRYKGFKEGHKRILVATDLVGRGIDIERVNIVHVLQQQPEHVTGDTRRGSIVRAFLWNHLV